MKDVDLYERLARLEERTESLEQSSESNSNKLDEIMECVNTLTSELGRYKGFLGGCVFVITALVSFFKLIGTGFLSHFMGK